MESEFIFKGDLLPREILIEIFSYLSLENIKNSSLTCKQWFTASMHRSVMKKRVFTFRNFCEPNGKMEFIKNVSTFPYNNMIIMDLYFHNRLIADIEFWEKYSNSLEILKLYVQDPLEIIFNILKDMKHLHTLDLIYSSRIDRYSKSLSNFTNETSELRNMKVLKMSIPFGSDKFHLVPTFLKMMPSLVHIEFDFSIYCPYQRKYELDSGRLNVRKELFDYLNKGKNRIKILILTVDVDTWDLISTIEGMNLETIAISCHHLGNFYIPSPTATIGSFTNGSTLLHLFTRKTDLRPICNNFPNLETITFRFSDHLSEIENINEIKKLKHLKNLSVDGCSEGLIKALSEYSNVLESLNLCFINHRSMDGKLSFKNFTNLTYLSCHYLNNTTDQEIQEIWKYLKQLRYLHLQIRQKSETEIITDWAFTGLKTTITETEPGQSKAYSISDMLYLQKLSIQILQNSIGDLSLSHISKCERLEYLHINCNSDLSTSFKQLKQSCPLLRDENICLHCSCHSQLFFELKLFPEYDVYASQKNGTLKRTLKAKFFDNDFHRISDRENCYSSGEYLSSYSEYENSDY